MKRSVPQVHAAQISVVNRQRRVPVDVRLYQRLLRNLLSLTRQSSAVVVGLTIVNDPQIRRMNARHRQIDRPTDVLAFPVRAFKSARPLAKRQSDGSYQGESRGMGTPACRQAGRRTVPHGFTLNRFTVNGPPLPKPDLPLIPIGDIVISIETAERQAREAGAALRDECRRLLIHGYLHLLGYDHERSTREALRMRRLERHLERQLIGLVRRAR